MALSIREANERFASDMSEANWLELQRLVQDKNRLDREHLEYMELAREAA